MSRVGIIGTGGMGNVHANHYKNIPGVEIHCFDNSDERGAAFLGRHRATGHESLESLLDACEAVDICLPTDLHLEVGLKALGAAKHVLIEKPMAHSVAECAQLVATAEKSGTHLVPGHVVRFFPEYALANRLVREGKIGNPAAVRTRRGGKPPLGSDLWFRDAKRSGGVLLDLAVHEFDFLRWTLGEVKSVFSKALVWSRPALAATVAGDYALTTLEFESGCVAHVEATWLDPSGFRVTFEFCGSEGMIEYDSRIAPSLRTHLASGSVQEGPMLGTDDPYFKQLSAFIAAVRGEREPAVSARDGLAAVAIARAAIESAESGKPVQPARG